MIGGRKVRSNKGKKRVSYGTRSRTRSGAKFRGRKVTKTRKTRKVRSNKGKKRTPYGRRYNSSGITRSGAKFRGGGPYSKVSRVSRRGSGRSSVSVKRPGPGAGKSMRSNSVQQPKHIYRERQAIAAKVAVKQRNKVAANQAAANKAAAAAKRADAEAAWNKHQNEITEKRNKLKRPDVKPFDYGSQKSSLK